MLPQTRYARSGNVHIAYQVVGDAATDLVFAHGWMSHAEAQWSFPEIASFLRALASFSRVIVFDKRGCGMSDRAGKGATMVERMDDLRAVMDAAGSERAVIFGVSEAAALAMLFAATNPDRTAALISYGGYARRIWSADYPWAPTVAQRQQYLEMVRRDWGGPMDLSSFAPSRAHDKDFVERFAAYLRQSASPGTAVNLARLNTYVDVREFLPKIRVPTLVLHRVHDTDPQVEEARYIARHIPGATLSVLPGRDHWPFVGDPRRLIRAMKTFVRALPIARSAKRPRRARKTRLAERIKLTPRQRDILELMAQGRSNREIATLLARSEHTVHRHVANILAVLGVSSRAAAVAKLSQDDSL
ncbi:MAG: alpha/beta fold hydrolase [Proteobacteria bacterium]|nr:alpha/beta fold hydrolase [Pseudomonadota bacterium]